MLLKPVDIGVVFTALAAVTALFFLSYSGKSGAGAVNVRGENGAWVFPLDAAESLVVSGPLGDTVVELDGGAARITKSPCLNQTCVSSGRIFKPGQWTACLPNRVMLYIDENEKDKNLDASAW